MSWDRSLAGLYPEDVDWSAMARQVCFVELVDRRESDLGLDLEKGMTGHPANYREFVSYHERLTKELHLSREDRETVKRGDWDSAGLRAFALDELWRRKQILDVKKPWPVGIPNPRDFRFNEPTVREWP